MEERAEELCAALGKQIQHSLEGVDAPPPSNIVQVVISVNNLIDQLHYTMVNDNECEVPYFWFALEDSVKAHIRVLNEFKVQFWIMF